MAILVSCPTCGKAISSTAWSCPHCGETEFTEPVYQKVKCRYCNGEQGTKSWKTINRVLRTSCNGEYKYTSLTTITTITRFGITFKELEDKILEDAKRKDCLYFTKTEDGIFSNQDIGYVEYYSIDPCTWCDGKGYTEKFVGRRDIRKPR